MVRIGLDDIYSFNKTHAPTGFDSTIQHLEKRHCRVYGVRLYKSTLRLLRNRDECTQRMFYGVENMIAGVVEYDSIRKHLAA